MVIYGIAQLEMSYKCHLMGANDTNRPKWIHSPTKVICSILLLYQLCKPWRVFEYIEKTKLMLVGKSPYAACCKICCIDYRANWSANKTNSMFWMLSLLFVLLRMNAYLIRSDRDRNVEFVDHSFSKLCLVPMQHICRLNRVCLIFWLLHSVTPQYT